MPTTQTDVESHAIELSAEAFEAFCEDISGMFNVDMACSQKEVCAETIEGLKKRYKKLTAVNNVKAAGALDGTFHLIFDQAGLFTLSGVIVMLPEKRILEEIKRGTIKDVESMNDAIKEVGNLLVGSWDRIFREGLESHSHFLLANTFIGNPWENPNEAINLAGDEELIFAPYEMKIDPYPPFSCGVIFPKKVFEPKSAAEKADVKEVKTDKKTAEANEQKTPVEKDDSEKNDTAAEGKESKPANEKKKTTKSVKKKSAAKAKNESVAEQEPDNTNETREVNITDEKRPVKDADSKVSETIQKIVRSPAILPGQSSQVSLSKCAEDIMEKSLVWCSSDENVQQALTKMQQHDTGYLLVGTEDELEGIISRSNITGAISPYLRPIFAKWRRPIDDATLKIRLKWIMSRPVRIIKPDMPITGIIETLCQFGCRCLPVVNQKGKVEGLVTVFDIFKILNDGLNISTAGKTLQVPPLI